MAPLPTCGSASGGPWIHPANTEYAVVTKASAPAGWSCGAAAERELRVGGKAGLPTTKAIDCISPESRPRTPAGRLGEARRPRTRLRSSQPVRPALSRAWRTSSPMPYQSSSAASDTSLARCRLRITQAPGTPAGATATPRLRQSKSSGRCLRSAPPPPSTAGQQTNQNTPGLRPGHTRSQPHR
jgi:hypothetical protein